MSVYAGLGVAQAILSFMLSFSFSYVSISVDSSSPTEADGLYSLSSLVASLTLFRAALSGVLRSPASFFDTTPMG
jgi:ATP-binding cassette subfamily C (CFTR/MRP) protein 1